MTRSTKRATSTPDLLARFHYLGIGVVETRARGEARQAYMAYMHRLGEYARIAKELKRRGALPPICAACKKARIDDRWVPIDQVINDQTEMQLSHGICPECAQRLYGDILHAPQVKGIA